MNFNFAVVVDEPQFPELVHEETHAWARCGGLTKSHDESYSFGACHAHASQPQCTTPNLEESVAKLAILGEQAGFTVAQMIRLLNAGLSVATLLELIAWRLKMFSHKDN